MPTVVAELLDLNNEEKYMSNKSTSASNAITIRLKLNHTPGLLAKVTTVIGENGGNIGAIDIIRV